MKPTWFRTHSRRRGLRLAPPHERDEFRLTLDNTGTMWLHVDRLLAAFGLTRAELRDEAQVVEAVRALAARMPTYVTLKKQVAQLDGWLRDGSADYVSGICGF